MVICLNRSRIEEVTWNCSQKIEDCIHVGKRYLRRTVEVQFCIKAKRAGFR